MNSLIELPRDIWWVILSKFPVYDLFRETFPNKLKTIVNSPKFRAWLMQLYKPCDDVYDIDINDSFLQPQNTFTIRNCNLRSNYDYCLNKNIVYCGFYDPYHTKQEHKQWNEDYFQQNLDIESLKGLKRCCDNSASPCFYHNEIFFKCLNLYREDNVFEKYRILTPIEMNNVISKKYPFEHNWNRHNISQIEPIFNITDKTKQLEQQLVLDSEGKPTNFPKPEKVKVDKGKLMFDYARIRNDRKHTVPYYVDVTCGWNMYVNMGIEYIEPLINQQLFDKSILYLHVS